VKEINAELPLSKATLNNWIKRYGWREEKRRFITTKMSKKKKIEEAFYSELDRMVNDVREGREINTRVDTLSKLHKVRLYLANVDYVGATIVVMRDLAEFLFKRDKVGVLKIIKDLTPGFIEAQQKKYREDRV